MLNKKILKDLVFDEEKHAYYYKGERKIGVTTVIDRNSPKPQLINWAVNVACNWLKEQLSNGSKIDEGHIELARKKHTEIKKDAASVGHVVHKWIEDHIKGLTPDMPSGEREINGVNAFLDWEAKNKPKYLYSELRLYSPRWDIAGTADIVAKIGGKLALVDIKTGNGVYDDAFVQTGAYGAILGELGGGEVDKIVVIRVGKDDGVFYEREISGKLIDLFQKRFDLYVKNLEIGQKLKEFMF